MFITYCISIAKYDYIEKMFKKYVIDFELELIGS